MDGNQQGFCIYPRDLEAEAESVPEIASAVVVGREESDGDESAVMFAVLKHRTPPAGLEEIRDRILGRLHKSVQPRFIEFLDEWPALSVGKIDVVALRKIAKEL